MTEHRLLHYVVKHPNTQVTVSLKQLVAEVQKCSSTDGQKAELLCDFSTVVRWVLSSHDRELIQKGKLSPYSTLYGGNFNSYSSCMLKFVESLEQVGIRPIFFLSGPPGSEKEDFNLNFDRYKEDTLHTQEACAKVEQVCAGSEDLLQIKWSLKEAISIQVQWVLKTAGVSVVGQSLREAGHYFISNHQVIGVVTSDVELAFLVPGLNIFLPDLQCDASPTTALAAGQCNAISSTSLTNATGLKESQLLDLVVLCRCDDEEVFSELGLPRCNLETLIKWLVDQNQPVDDESHPKFKGVKLEIKNHFLLPPPYEFVHVTGPGSASCDLNTEKKSENVMASSSLTEIVAAKVQAGSMMPSLLSMVQGRYWRSSAVELASLGQPCVNDLTLALRKLLYSLMGLKRVTEYGQTGTKSFDTISVELKCHVECGVSFLKSLEEWSRNERLSLLFDLVANQQSYRDSDNLQCRISSAYQMVSGVAEPIPSAAVPICASLLLLFKSNEVVSSFPQVRYFELDALLISCLTCAADYPPHVLLHRPPTQAVRIAMYFSHILEQVYMVASYLGLLSDLPPPARLFYSMAYIPYHVAGLSEDDARLTSSHGDKSNMTKIRDQFSSLQHLEPVLGLRAEIINNSECPDLPSLLRLFTSSVDAVTAHKEKVSKEDATASSLLSERGGGFNLSLDKVDDAYLSSSVNSDSSILAKCNEFSSAQDYQASEEDLFFVSMLGDVFDGEEDDRVMDEDGCRADDEVFPVSDTEELIVDTSCKELANDEKMNVPEVDLQSTVKLPDKGSHQQLSVCQSSLSEPVMLHKSSTQPSTTQVTIETSIDSATTSGPSLSGAPPTHKDNTAHFPPPARDNPARFPPPTAHYHSTTQEHELPVLVHREKILHLVHNHRVVCIEGETGCGKSTKIPQFILDDSLSSNPAIPCRILVTQPRRVAVVKLAERVAAERRERIGQTVGYCIGGERHRTSETALTYCTVGYLLHALVHNPSMILHYTHIILDEIHERSTDADFALIIVRRLVANSSSLKVIIMSATMESNLIASYFEKMVSFTDVAEPYFVGSKRYNVERYFIDELDQLVNTKKLVWSEWQVSASSRLKELVLKQPPENLPEALTRKPSVTLFAQRVCTEVIISQANLGEQILVFLPGISEIAEYYEMLCSVLERQNLSDHFMVFVMHSQVPFEDQKEVFKPPPLSKAHVILATNIAESSITLPRLRLVINFGIYRQLEYNAKRHMSQLTKKWCSQASCAQRAGRAGRVFEGVAVHLFTRQFFWIIAPEFDPPEILHAPLAKLVLQAKQIGSKMGVPSPSEFLSQAIDPPSLEQMELALKELASFGAIVSQPGTSVVEEAEITLLGRFALTLPLDIEFSRLVLYSIFFGIPTDGIIIAAAASLSQDVFSLPTRLVMKEENVYGDSLRRSMKSRYYFDGGEFSDAVMVCNMFREWIEHKNLCCTNASLQMQHSFLRVFCNKHSVRWQRLLQLEHTIAEIACRVLPLIPSDYYVYDDLRALSDITSYRRGYSFMSDMEEGGGENGGRKHRKLRLCVVNLHFCEDVNIIKALMAAAFCHNFVLGHRGPESTVLKEKTEADQALTCMRHLSFNPAETIMFRSDLTATGVDVQNLVSTVLPRRNCEYRLIDRFWYVYLHPEFNTNPKTSIMRGGEQDAVQAMSSDDSHDSVISQKLSQDICYFWQYGERSPTWKVADATFSRPQHPFIVNWTRISKNKEKVFIRSWRNPSGLVCDVSRVCAPFLGVVSFMQGLQFRNAVAGRGVTLLPSLSLGKEALLLLLAFQPQDVKVGFVMKQDVITCLKIDSFSFPLPIALCRMISADDLVHINELREAISRVMRIDLETVHRLPIEEMSTIHSLLKCVLSSTPSNLTCPSTSESEKPITVLEASQQMDGIVDDDSEFEFDVEEMSTMDKNDRTIPLSAFQFYPPLECPLLQGCMVRPIPPECLESNYLFQKKTSHGVFEGIEPARSFSTPSPSHRAVGWQPVEELDEIEKLKQEGQQVEMCQEHTSFRLSPLAEPFFPKVSNLNTGLLPCPPSIASHSQQYQSMQGFSVHDDEVGESTQGFPLHDGNTPNIQSNFELPTQDVHQLHNYPIQNLQDYSGHNVQNYAVQGVHDGSGFGGNQPQMGYGMVNDTIPPPPPSPLPVSAGVRASEVDMSSASYVVPESAVGPLLPDAQSLYLQSLLQLVENVLQHPGAMHQDMHQAKAICQYLLSGQVQNQEHMQPHGPHPQGGCPQMYAHYSEQSENEPSSLAAVQDTDTFKSSENTVETDSSVAIAKKHTESAQVDDNGAGVIQPVTGEQTADDLQHTEEGRASSNMIPSRPLRSPTTGLVEERVQGKESALLEDSQTCGRPAIVEESSAQTDDKKETKELEEERQDAESPMRMKPQGEAATRESDGELKESSQDQAASEYSSKLDAKVDRSSTNQEQTVSDSDHPLSGAEVKLEALKPVGGTSLPVSIPSLCAAPVTSISVTIPRSQTTFKEASEPQLQQRLTKSDNSLHTTQAAVDGSGNVYHISPVLASHISQLTQALLSPPRHPLPLPLPLSQLVLPQQNRPSSAFLIPPRGHSYSGQLSPSAQHHSFPTLPGSNLNTAPVRPFHSSPALANTCSSSSINFASRQILLPLPNTSQISPPCALPAANTVQLSPVVPQSVLSTSITQPSSKVQRSESIGQVQPMSPQRVVAQTVPVPAGVSCRGGLMEVPSGIVPQPHPVVQSSNVSSTLHGRRAREREVSAKKHPQHRHCDPILRYQGPPQTVGMSVHPPGLACPLPPPPPPPSSYRKRRSRPPPPPPPHPALLTNYTARHKIPPLIPALLPSSPSHHVHNHQASGLHVQPLKYMYNRRGHETQRKPGHKTQRKPSYELYGLPEETLVNCYCTLLSTFGMDLQLNLMCGPYYRDILKCFRICAQENELLDPHFFDRYSCFKVYGEPGHYMVKLKSVKDIVEHHRKQQEQKHGSNTDEPSMCEAPPTGDAVHATGGDRSQSLMPATEAEPITTGNIVTKPKTTDTTLTQPECTGAQTDAVLSQPESVPTQSITTGAVLTQPKTTDAISTQPQTSLMQPDAQPETADVRLTYSETSGGLLTQPEAADTQPGTSPEILTQTEATLTQSKTTSELPEIADTQCVQSEITDAQTEVTDVPAELTNAQPEITNAQTEITNVQVKSADAQCEITNAQTEVTDVQTELTNTQSEITNAQIEITNAQSEINDAQPEITYVQAEIELETAVASPGGMTQAKITDVSLTYPETTDATLTQPVTADATLTQPKTTDATLMQLKTTDATLTQSETSDATLIQPETTDATLTQPETTDATLTQPDTTDATLTQPDTTDATLTRFETVEATLTQPETTDATLTQPETTAQSEAIQTHLESIQIQAETLHDEYLIMQSDTTQCPVEIHPALEAKHEINMTHSSLAQSEISDSFLAHPQTTDSSHTQLEISDTWSVIEATFPSDLETGDLTAASVGDEDLERDDLQMLDDTLVADDTVPQVIIISEEEEEQKDKTLLSLTNPPSQTVEEEIIKKCVRDSWQLAPVTTSGSISGEDRPSSVASFDEDCWVECGHPEVYSAPEIATDVHSGPERKRLSCSVGYDEDCWQESAPQESVDTTKAPFRPVRILKREDSGRAKPFDAPRDQRKPPMVQSSRTGAAESDGGGRTSKDEQNRSNEFKRRKKSKSKRKNRNVQDEKRGERYSPYPQASIASSRETGDQRSMSSDRGERRQESRRYEDNGRERYRREWSRNQPRRSEGESDEGVRKRPTQEFRRHYGSYRPRYVYGEGWKKEKEKLAQKPS